MFKMLNVKIYKDTNGNFKKSIIEFRDDKAFNLISSAFVSQLNIVEDNIKSAKNDNVKKMFQKEFNKIVEMLDQLEQPIIVKNEKNELISRMREMEVVYKTLNDYSHSI